MMRRDNIYIKHILESISRIEKYIDNVQYEEFIKYQLLQDGVIRQLEIIGEATKRLSTEMKQKSTKIPWKDISGMRDKLIHNYFGVDLEEVWRTIKKDIPFFKRN